MRLTAERWEMEIRPERGGRISSLRLDGEEILDQGIGVDQPTAEGFVEGGAWGWDEMVPNLEPTESLPDHGEAWRLPWTVVAQSEISVGMSCEGVIVPWRLGRMIVLRDKVDVFYQYTNTGTTLQAAYWCAHPLFRYEEGMDVSVDMPRPDRGTSGKTFLTPGSIDRVALRWASGAGVEMRWDSFLTPGVAIWVCNGDLGGYEQLAIEPSLATSMLAPGQSLQWWLQLTPLSPSG